ncbi:hypothetical protein Gpo141_00003685 [Globisporangium polare]
MKDDHRVAAEVIGQQIDAMQGRVQQSGVMAYLAKDSHDRRPRKDVNKQFLTSTIRSVDQHNRRHAEETSWKDRHYWARKKAERTKQIWEKLHNANDRNVSVENAPEFRSSSEDSDDADVKARARSSTSSSESNSDDDDRKTSSKKKKKKRRHKSKKDKKRKKKHKSRKE